MRNILVGVLLASTAASAHAQSFNTVGAGNTLVTSTVAAPGTNTASRAITGLGAGEAVVGLDYRPASRRVLYTMTNNGNLYAVNPNTAVATRVGTPGFVPAGPVAFDFNPSVDRIRVVTTTGQNVRLNPTVTGTTSTFVATDGAIRYTDGTVAIPTVAGTAYSNNTPGTANTTMYVIDTRGGTGNAVLARAGSLGGTPVSPNTGELTAIGSLGVGSSAAVGFDILTQGTTNTAYATLTNATGDTSLYSVNLTTGAATLIGSLAGTNTTYTGLALALAPFQTFGATANQQAVGARLDGFTGVPSAAVTALFNGIDATPAAQQANALSQLTPAAYTLLPEISMNAVEAQETNILRYLRDLRGNAVTPDGQRVNIDEAGRFGAFVLGGARFGSYNGAVDRPRVTNDSYHFLGGVDLRLNERITVGAYGGWNDTNARLTPFSQSSSADSWFAGGFGTVGVGPFYVDLQGGYTDLDFDLSRGYAFGGVSGTNTASTGGRIWSVAGATGLSFSLGNFEVEPFAQLRYADIRINGFTETGSAAALALPRVDAESFRLNLGGRLGTKFDAMGAVVRVQARGAWLREFELHDQRTFNVNFTDASLGGTAFAFTTNPLSNEYYNVGAALNIAGSGPFSVVADYDVQFDDDREFHALTIGGRLAF